MIGGLRLNIGDEVQLIDGKGGFHRAKIIDPNPKKCSVEIIESTLDYGKRNHYLHIAIAPTKNIDRFEWFLEKATEIGIDTITPILCDHSERKVIKLDRFEKILQSAMKQSLQCYLPTINELTPFNNFVNQDFKGQKYIAHCEDSDRKSLKNQLKPDQDIVILIGPEGDFSVKEIETALQHNFIPVTLGNTRLRTETAAIAACHSVAFVNE